MWWYSVLNVKLSVQTFLILTGHAIQFNIFELICHTTHRVYSVRNISQITPHFGLLTSHVTYQNWQVIISIYKNYYINPKVHRKQNPDSYCNSMVHDLLYSVLLLCITRTSFCILEITNIRQITIDIWHCLYYVQQMTQPDPLNSHPGLVL